MAKVLDKSEVDELLAAVDAGPAMPPPQPERIFSRNRHPGEAVEIKVYDFKRPERVSKDQMRALQTLHEAFARNFGAALSGFLRTICEVKVAACEQTTYAEFIASLPNPTSFNLLSLPPLEGKMCLEISPLIVYPIIDRLLGGSNTELFIPQRPMTMIETRLIHKITDRALEALSEAWENVRKLEFTLSESESNPQLVQIVPPNEVTVVIGFELKMGSRAGTMSLCLPYNVIEPLLEDLTKRSWTQVGRTGGSEEFSRRIAGRLGQAALDVSGLLAETTITLRDLLTLGEGDFILTDKPATAPVVLCVGGEKKYHATLGQFRNARSLRVVRPVAPGDHV